jgi:hypothetical protein
MGIEPVPVGKTAWIESFNQAVFLFDSNHIFM